jgi:hypothetical protein
MKSWTRRATIAAALALTAGTGYTVFAAPPTVDVLDAILAELKSLNTNLTTRPECCTLVRDARKFQGLVVNPLDPSTHTLVSINGPGKFVSAELTKQGGLSGLTFVTLRIDGQSIENRSVIALKNLAMTQNNPFGVMVGTSPAGIDAVTIGFPQTLEFKNKLELEVQVAEPGVVQLIGTVIAGH